MKQKSIRTQFADTMLAIGREDENLAVLVGDISHFILQPFAKACPGRYYNVGICEPTIISMAAGLSKVGFHPVVHTIAPFIVDRGFEQIKLDFCYQQLGGNLITVGSAFDYSNLGCTHHCCGDFALMKTLPRTEIVYPGSAVEFDMLFRAAYRNAYLTLYRIPSVSHGVEFSPGDIHFGQGIRVTEGPDVTVVATGPHLKTALEAQPLLDGVGMEIIYLHTIRPLDVSLIRKSVAKTRRVITVEEHMQSGGLGDDVLRHTCDLGHIRYESLSIPDRFLTEYGRYEDQCRRIDLTPEGLARRIRQMVPANNREPAVATKDERWIKREG